MKKVRHLLLATVLLLCMAVSVHAMGCCEVYDITVEERDEGIVVSFDLSLMYADNYRDISVTLDTCAVKATDLGDGRHSVTLPKSELPEMIKGEKYTIRLSFVDTCPHYPESDSDSWVEFTCQKGVPVVEYSALTNGKLELVGQSSAIVKVKAPADGLYTITAARADGRDHNLNLTPADRDWGNVDKYNFFDQNEEYLFRVANRDGSDLDVTIIFEKAVVPEAELKAEQPGDGDVCFEFTCEPGLMYKFTIPKAGVYFINASTENERDWLRIECQNEFDNFSSTSGQVYELLKEGEYYVNAENHQGNMEVSIRYSEPKPFDFSKTYTLEDDENQYYMLDVDRPMLVSRSGDELYTKFTKGDRNYYLSDILLAGEYYFLVSGSNGAGTAEYTAEYFHSGELDTPLACKKLDGNYYSYAAFQAPEDGVYEFDYTSLSEIQHTYNEEIWSNQKLDQLEMKQGEWVLIRATVQEDEEILVRKYQKPQPIELTLNVPSEFEFISGKTYCYTFTPTASGVYKFLGEKRFLTSVKIYTDEAVLMERDSLGFVLSLTENIPVYIELFGEYEPWESDKTDSITVAEAVTELSLGSNSITVNEEYEEKLSFSVQESGFYQLQFRKSNLSAQLYYALNESGEQVELAQSTQYRIVYVEAGTPLSIELTCVKGDNDMKETNLSLTISELTVEDERIEEDQQFDHSYDDYHVFVPKHTGLYGASTKLEVSSLDAYGIHFFAGADSTIFSAVEGETYLLKSVNGGLKDTISRLEVSEIGLDTAYVADGEINVYSLTIDKEGYYRADVDGQNAFLFLFDGGWKQIKNGGTAVLDLSPGEYYLAVQKNEVSAVQIEKGHYEPRLEFEIRKDDSEPEWSIEAEACYYNLSQRGHRISLSGTVPHGVKEVTVGVEFMTDWGFEGRATATCDVDGTDHFWCEISVSGSVTQGKTYVFKPFCMDNNQRKVYGKEASITVDGIAVTKRLEANHVKTAVEMKPGYESSTQYFVYEFTQPADWEGTTEIQMPFFDANYGIYGDHTLYTVSGSTVRYKSLRNGVYTYELTAGETYFIRVNTANAGIADIHISSLPDPVQQPGTEVYELLNVKKTHDGMRFDVAGDVEDKSGWTAIYDESGRMLDIALWHDGSAKLDRIGEADACKLVFLGENYIPFGPGAKIEF